ncbi:lysosome membrane protein 2 [Folsomia candida]|uniref:Scavenger receptor class B member 1 n=1 Tax=Folsomia candida TaxID=158441 RepID=A0A226DGS2_FOLCA|nr:lysosome membrane protein 2 [Folsomia candida]OXA43801.1 Lysosome membrane protein 2 [Folsomia candida]
MAGNKSLMFVPLFMCMLTFVSSASSRHHTGRSSYEPHLDLIPGKETFQGNHIFYYMYNITNPDEFEAGLEKPMFQEIGPYCFKETRRKYDVKKISESAMSYNLDRYWEFVPELSEGHKETDEFNIINIPMIILANKLSAKRLPKAFNDILVEELSEKGETLVRRSEELGNIIYYGMNVSIYTEILSDVLQGNVPPEFSDGIFALLKGKNGSSEGTFTVRSKGKEMGDILTFNNKTKLEYWGGDFCNKIDGTDGYFFRPGVNEKSTLKIFYPELCRSVYLKWTGEKKVDGIKVGKFMFPEDMLEDSEVKSENQCFCSKPIAPTNNTREGCLKKGFVDYAGCKQESPLLVSYPHFLYADDEYREKLVGMKPRPEKHESEFLVEPTTGTIVSGVRKFQFNVKLRPLDNVELFRNTTFMIVPVFITERRMIVDDGAIDKLKQDLKKLSEEDEKPVIKELDLAQNHEEKKHEDQDSNVQSDQPPSEESAAAEPEPEPESNADNEIDTSNESKFKSQSVTKNRGSSSSFNYDMFPLLVSSLFAICIRLNV